MSDGMSNGGVPPLPSGESEAAVASRSRTTLLAGVAVAAGFACLLMYRFVIGDPVLRYLIPAADAVALVLGVWLLARADRRRERWDMALGALATGGVSLYLFLSSALGPEPSPGGT